MTDEQDARPNAPELEEGAELESTRHIKIGVTIFMILLVVGAMFGAAFLQSIVRPTTDATPAETVEVVGEEH